MCHLADLSLPCGNWSVRRQYKNVDILRFLVCNKLSFVSGIPSVFCWHPKNWTTFVLEGIFAVRSIPVLYQEICKQLKGHLKNHMFIQSICIHQEIEEENVNDNKLISINFIIKKTLHVSFFILLFFLHFICMGILPTCMSVYHVHAWYPLKTVKDISIP